MADLTVPSHARSGQWGCQRAFQKRKIFLLPKGGQGMGLLEENYCAKKSNQPLLESDD